jgi:hypothetical protein
MIGAGQLHDEYEKVGEAWKFRSRKVEIFYFRAVRNWPRQPRPRQGWRAKINHIADAGFADLFPGRTGAERLLDTCRIT